MWFVESLERKHNVTVMVGMRDNGRILVVENYGEYQSTAPKGRSATSTCIQMRRSGPGDYRLLEGKTTTDES